MDRDDRNFERTGWGSVVDRLALGGDLDEWARSFKAFVRPRGIDSAATLLRLILAWAVCGKSLRQVSLWASSEGIASVSDEALTGRFANCGSWLADMVARHLLAGGDRVPSMAGRRFRILDGSTLSVPGSDKPRYRLLLSFDPHAQRTLDATLVPASAGELSVCGQAEAGDIILADRNFARPDALRTLRERGADYLVRLGARSLRLTDAQGHVLRIIEQCRIAAAQGHLDRSVLISNARSPHQPPLPARFVIRPFPADIAERNRARLRRQAQQGGHAPSADALEIAGYMMMVTSLPAETTPIEQLEPLYRCRWQIEIAFKRLKSLSHLDTCPARTDPMARTWIAANLLCALIAEDLAHEVLDSPPSGPRRPTKTRRHLAPRP